MNESLRNEEPLLTDADIQEFIEIYKEEFRETLSPKDAREMASGFLELYRVLYAPPPSAQPIHKSSTVEKVNPLKTLARKVIDIVRLKKPEK